MEQATQAKTGLYSRIGLLLLFSALVAGLFILPFNVSTDGAVRYQFMDTLVHQFRITPMLYSIVGPLFSLPLWLISGFFKDPTAVIARYNYLLFAIFLFGLYQWLKGLFEKKLLITFLFLLAFGSMFPGHLLNYYGEVFSAVCLGLGTVALATRKPAVGWILSLLSVLNTPPMLIPFSFVVMYQVWETRKLRYFLLVPAGLLLLVLESYLRTGSLLTGFQTYLNLDHGYQTVLPYSGRIGYSYPFFLGVLSILFSFGKGLIFYCPGLLLIGWAWKTISDPVERKLLTLWSLIVLGLILAYASWWAWYGGWYWGPRFFLFASVPASWILAKLVHTGRKSLLSGLVLSLFVVYSLWIGVNGVVFQQKTLDACTNNNFAFEYLCWYVPEFSPLLRPFVQRAALHQADKYILFLFASAWLYLLPPLVLDLYRQLKTAITVYAPRIHLSAWKL